MEVWRVLVPLQQQANYRITVAEAGLGSPASLMHSREWRLPNVAYEILFSEGAAVRAGAFGP